MVLNKFQKKKGVSNRGTKQTKEGEPRESSGLTTPERQREKDCYGEGRIPSKREKRAAQNRAEDRLLEKP